jgi:phosphatidylserine/phosphatidylglycerophosphate/cardiolipin synthase-like enzyme
VKLLVQPESGVTDLIAAIKRAKKSVEVAIFRFDIRELEKALEAAVSRGVVVHALIAQTNQGGAKLLRQLEMRLLEAGVTVSRTADDLVRYHGKYLVIDRTSLWVLGFNSTHVDVFRSRSFGLVTTNRALVHEAGKVFEADSTRQPYQSASSDLVISPENARARLGTLIKSARKQLLIYDPRISDGPMLQLCQERAQAGVDVRILGGVSGRGVGLRVEKLQDRRLHVRAIVRDGIETFVGSQSLRGVELDRRREVGIIVRNRRIARQFQAVFEADWARRVEMSAKDARLSRDQAGESQPSPA